MIDNTFRQLLPRFVGPLLRAYAACGLTPNGVSSLGFGLAAVAAFLVTVEQPLGAIAVWWLSRLFDGTDGVYARATGTTSGFGAYLDIVLDMAAYGLMIVAFDRVHPELHAQWMWIVFLYVLCITSALVLGFQEAASDIPARDDRGLRLGAGLAEGGETGIAYTVFLLLPGWLEVWVWAWIVVLATTVVARTVLARRML